MTIKDIAKLAKVSTTTVSKVINNKADNISEETQDRILAIIKEQNYVPYKTVVDRVSQKSDRVALIVSDASDIFCSQILRGVEDYFFLRGVSVIICSTDGNPQKEVDHIHMLRKQNVSGIIHFPPVDEEIWKLEQEETYRVMLDNYKGAPNALKTFFNNKEGGNLATSHLIDAGHDRIGYITPKPERPYLMERLAGYRKALENHHIKFDESLVYRTDDTNRSQSGYDGAKYLMSQKVTAIFCCDDYVAMGVYRAIHENGLCIPDDISVVGFDDMFYCEMLEPQLSSIKQPAYDIGWGSAEMLYSKIQGIPLKQTSVQIAPQIIQRDSVMSPNSRRVDKLNRIIVAGEIRADICMQVHEPAQLDVAHNAEEVLVTAGGWAVNKVLELMGERTEVYLLGSIGNDAYGRQVFNDLQKKGVKLDGVIFDRDKTTSTAFITQFSDGQRSEVICTGAGNAMAEYPIHEAQWIFQRASACYIGCDLPDKFIQDVKESCKGNCTKIFASI